VIFFVSISFFLASPFLSCLIHSPTPSSLPPSLLSLQIHVPKMQESETRKAIRVE